MEEDRLEAARRAKAKFKQRLPKGLDIVGIGIGTEDSSPTVKVNLGTEPKNASALPKSVEGVPVVYEVTGAIKARASASVRRASAKSS